MSMKFNKIITISSEVLAQEVAGEMVLLDLEREQYLGLNEVGATVWQLLEKNNNLNSIFEKLLEEYNVETEILENDLHQLITDMSNSGIITVEEQVI